MSIKIKAMLAPWSDKINLLIVDINFGHIFIAEPLTMREVSPSALIEQSTLSLDREAAQELMDNLWQCGLRPTEGSGSAGALAATQKHLDDMQKISFELLEKVLNLPTLETREAKD